MKNVLIIAYYYPPKGGAGVQRTTKFANYLSKFGYNVNVLTVKENSEGLKDFSLKEDINKNISVYRTDIKEINIMNNLLKIAKKKTNNSINTLDENLSNNSSSLGAKKIKLNLLNSIKNYLKKMFLNLYNLMFIPDDKKGWIDFAVSKGREIIIEKNIDIIYTTSGPYSTHLIGYKLNKEFGTKWIADFRDPWASNPFVEYNFLVQKIFNKLEAKVVKNANKIISVSKPIIEDFIKRYPDEDINKFVTIPNGYDEEDFQGLNLELSEKNSKFVILYNGTLYGKRSPEKILFSIDNLINKNIIDKNKIQIRFVGEIGTSYIELINYYKNKYKDVVIHRPYMPHKESLIELCKANALLLIIDEGKGSEGIYTGKIFEYIRTGKTILGLVPNGVAKDLIEETSTGYTALPSDQSAIENIILKAYNDFIYKTKSLTPNLEVIKKYSRENLTKLLIEEIKKIE